MLEDDKKEIEEIKKVIQEYSDAFNNWNAEKLVKAFHPESMVYWYRPERKYFYKGMCYAWLDGFFDNKREDPGIKFHVISEEIHQRGYAAYARVRFLIDDPKGPRDTTDYLTLLKINSKWRVFNKSGHTVDISKEELTQRIKEKSEFPKNDPAEIKQIQHVLRTYAEAFHEWDIEKIRETIHPEMRINLFDKKLEKLKNMFRPLPMWKESFEHHINEGITFDITFGDVDQTGTAAVATMKWIAHTPNGTGDTLDFLTLLKIEDKWFIVNKSCDIDFEKKMIELNKEVKK